MNGKLCFLYFIGKIDVADHDFIYALSCHNEYFYGGKLLYENKYKNKVSLNISTVVSERKVFIRITNIEGKDCYGIGKLVGIV